MNWMLVPPPISAQAEWERYMLEAGVVGHLFREVGALRKRVAVLIRRNVVLMERLVEPVELGIPQAQNPTVACVCEPPLSISPLATECTVQLWVRRPYTVVLMTHPIRGTTMGIAKVSRGDKWDERKGAELAYLRALREMAKRQ